MAVWALVLHALPAQAYNVDWSSTYHIDSAYSRLIEQNQENYQRWYGKKAPSHWDDNCPASWDWESCKKRLEQRRNANKSSSQKQASIPPSQPNAHRYTYSRQVSEQVDAEMLNTLRQNLQQRNALTPQAEQELQRMKNDRLIDQVRQALRSDGYDTDSLATALTYWVVVNYGISQRADLSRLRGHEMARQFQASFADMQAVAGMNSADKQRVADTLYWMGSLQMATYLDATRTGNQAALQRCIQDAQTALRQLGVQGRIRNGSKGLELS